MQMNAHSGADEEVLYKAICCAGYRHVYSQTMPSLNKEITGF